MEVFTAVTQSRNGGRSFRGGEHDVAVVKVETVHLGETGRVNPGSSFQHVSDPPQLFRLRFEKGKQKL